MKQVTDTELFAELVEFGNKAVTGVEEFYVIETVGKSGIIR